MTAKKATYAAKLSIYAFAVLFILFIAMLHKSQSVPADSAAEGVDVPVIMYHSILKDESKVGKYVITPSQLSSDIDWLVKNGYTSVSMQELIDYVYNNAPLPQKPVLLSFDDGCYNNLGYAVPVLEEYGAKGVFATVGEYTEQYSDSNEVNLAYSYMRWYDIKLALKNHPCVEFANHSYGFHSVDKGRNGSQKKKNEDSETYKKIFFDDTALAQELYKQNTGFEPYIYVYPFGSYSEESFDILKQLGFKASLSCTEGINFITHNPECLYIMKRYNRPAGITSYDYFSKILK